MNEHAFHPAGEPTTPKFSPRCSVCGKTSQEHDLCFPCPPSKVIITKPGADVIKDSTLLEIVGHCPSCGSPVYGKRQIGPDDTVIIRRSCSCWTKPGAIQNYATKG